MLTPHLRGMQRALTTHYDDLSEPGSDAAFNVLIAYEDFKAGKHAMATYDFLVNTLGRDCAFTNQMWKFDVLSIAKLREMAVRDAQGADIIIISCGGAGELPPHVKSWADEWASGGKQALALVALFDSDAEDAADTQQIRDYLRGIATQARIEFFAQPNDWPGSGVQGRSMSTGRDFQQRTLTTLAGAVDRDVGVLRWGINE